MERRNKHEFSQARIISKRSSFELYKRANQEKKKHVIAITLVDWWIGRFQCTNTTNLRFAVRLISKERSNDLTPGVNIEEEMQFYITRDIQNVLKCSAKRKQRNCWCYSDQWNIKVLRSNLERILVAKLIISNYKKNNGCRRTKRRRQIGNQFVHWEVSTTAEVLIG